ncbi:MAG: amidophosphoribosyltransferase, partial [Nanoarchaeota archaeon]
PLKGAYSIVGITQDTLFGIRDPFGFKPLSLARLNGGYILSSETTAFLDVEGAEWVQDVLPGTVITINKKGVQEHRFADAQTLKPCVFEHVYFARPDSHIAGRNVHLARVEFGRQLYREHPTEADVVVAVEDSGRSAAEGLAEESGIPLRRGLIRNHYIGRTFTRPENVLRERGVNLKLSPLPEVLRDQRVLLVEDSVVRGNTARSRVRLVRQAGAREVHLYVSSPKIIGDCLYGIDFHKEQLRTTTMPDDNTFRSQIGVDGLHHLSLEGMYAALARVPLDPRAHLAYQPQHFCDGCMTGVYPVPRES